MEKSLFLFVYKNRVLKQIILYYINYIHKTKCIRAYTWESYSSKLENLVYHGYTQLFNKVMKNYTVIEIARMRLGTSAAKRGHIDILKKLQSIKALRGDEVNLSVLSGKLEVFQYLASLKSQEVTTMAMDLASKNGDFEMLKWMHNNRTEGCTTNAIDYAAINNHIEIVQWLFDNRTEGCSFTSFDWAARNGNFKMIDILMENNKSQWNFSTKAIDLAAKNNQIDMVRYLTETYPNLKCTSDAFDSACLSGNLELVRYLNENRTEGGTHLSLWYSTTNGYLDITKYLFENTKYQGMNNMLSQSIFNGHIEVAYYLIDNHPPGYLEGTEVGYAARQHSYDLVVKLLNLNLYFNAPHAMKMALENGQIDIIVRLDLHFDMNYNLFEHFNMSKLVMQSYCLKSIRWYIEKYPEKIDEIKAITSDLLYITWSIKVDVLEYLYKLGFLHKYERQSDILYKFIALVHLPALKHFHEVLGIPIPDRCLEPEQLSTYSSYIRPYLQECLDKKRQQQQQQDQQLIQPQDENTTTSETTPTTTTSDISTPKQNLSRRQLKKNRNKD